MLGKTLLYVCKEGKSLEDVDSTVRVGRQLEKARSNQLTELETKCVIQPSLLCLRLHVSLATRIFGKPRWLTRPRLVSESFIQSLPLSLRLQNVT